MTRSGGLSLVDFSSRLGPGPVESNEPGLVDLVRWIRSGRPGLVDTVQWTWSGGSGQVVVPDFSVQEVCLSNELVQLNSLND